MTLGIYYNLARMYTETTGDSDVTLTTAVPGCKTFALAGASDSGEYEYGLITYDLITHRPTGSETGIGKYISSGTVFKRTTVEASTDSDNSAINLTGLTEIYLCPIASGFNNGMHALAVYSNAGASNSASDSYTNLVLTLDTEDYDNHGIGSLSGNTVTILATKIDYALVSANVYISGLSAFDGYITLKIFGPYTAEISKGYTSAMGILSDVITIGPVPFDFRAGGTLQLKITNQLGLTIDAYVSDLTIKPN